MTRGRFWHILTCFLPIAAIELSPEQVDYSKPDIVIDKRWVVNWSNIYYCLGTHKNRHCLTTYLRLSGCIRRSALLLSGSIRVCFDFVFPWSWANETTAYNNLFTLIHEEILSVTWDIFHVTANALCLRARWYDDEFFLHSTNKYLISCTLNDFDLKLVPFHCFGNAKN